MDDARETPALKFIKLAESEGFTVCTYDPLVRRFETPLSGMEDAVKGTDGIVIIMDHDEFKGLDYGHCSIMQGTGTCSARGMWSGRWHVELSRWGSQALAGTACEPKRRSLKHRRT